MTYRHREARQSRLPPITLLAAIILIAGHTYAYAQIVPSRFRFELAVNNLVILRGHVSDANVKPISGARVTLIDQVDGVPRSALSNDLGDFKITDLIPGRKYLITTAWSGIFSSTEITIPARMPRLPSRITVAPGSPAPAAQPPLIGPIPEVQTRTKRAVPHLRVMTASGKTKEELGKLLAKIEGEGETVQFFLPVSYTKSLVILDGKAANPPQNFVVQIKAPLDEKTLHDALEKYALAGKVKGIHVIGGTQFFLVLSLE